MKIDQALGDLYDTIQESQIYVNYRHVLNQVMKNKDINNTVEQIRILQKKMVKEEIVKKKDISKLEQKLEVKKQLLYSIPLYQEYIVVSDELNSLVKNVSDRMQMYLNSLDI